MSVSSPSFLCGSSDGRLYLVGADGTTAVAISQADFDVLSYNGVPTYELSDAFINALRNVGGSGLAA